MVPTPLLGLLLLTAVPDVPCSPRPLPPAIDHLAPLDRLEVVTFAATPSHEYPGHAWVVRISQNSRKDPAAVEIVRLRRQSNCNSYTVLKRWTASIPPDQFRTLVIRLSQPITPDPDIFYAIDSKRDSQVVLGGTAVILRLRNLNWEVTRKLHAEVGEGWVVSALFHELVSRYVPTSDLPSSSWERRQVQQRGEGQ